MCLRVLCYTSGRTLAMFRAMLVMALACQMVTTGDTSHTQHVKHDILTRERRWCACNFQHISGLTM